MVSAPAVKTTAPKAKAKKAAPKVTELLDSDEDEEESQTVAKKSTKSKLSTSASQPTKPSSKPRPTPRFRKKDNEDDDDDDDDDNVRETSKSKANASSRSLGKKRAADEGPGVSGLGLGLPSSSSQRDRDDSAINGSEPAKKKKRIMGGGFGAPTTKDAVWNRGVSFFFFDLILARSVCMTSLPSHDNSIISSRLAVTHSGRGRLWHALHAISHYNTARSTTLF